MAGQIKRTSRKALTRLRDTRVGGGRPGTGAKAGKVPGPSPNPASNIIFTDVAIWMASSVLRRTVERGLLANRYGPRTAVKISENRSLAQRAAIMVISRLATSSLPGAAIVTTGMAAKILLDRSRARHDAQREGDRELLEPTRDD